MLELNKIHHGDCLELMKEIPDKSIDMVLADPPYGTTQSNWDLIIPFEPMWEQLHRIIKKNRAILIFGSEPFSSFLRISNIKNYKYDWYWRKPKGTGHLNSKKMPLKDTETISVFQEKINYFPQFKLGLPYNKNKVGKINTTESYRHYTSFRNDNDGFRYPKTGIDFPVVERNTLHPTQKPTELLEYLIKTYTHKLDTILDFTIGSGSTAIACINTNRQFLGIEKELKYVGIANERINNHVKDK